MQNTSSSKTIGIVIVLIIIIAGIWLMMRKPASDTSDVVVPATSSQNTGTQGNGTTAAATVDVSDAALNQDSAAIDAQMGTLSTNTAAANN